MSKSKIADDQIAKTAYLLWLDAGKPHGRDQEFWYHARDLLTEAAKAGDEAEIPAPAKPKRRAAAKKAAPSDATVSDAPKKTRRAAKPKAEAAAKEPKAAKPRATRAKKA